MAIRLPGLTSSSSSLISDTLRSTISGTASITMSALATSFRSGLNVIRASTSSRLAWSILPRSTAPASDFSTRAWAASRNCGRSRTTTGMPATADTSAMPAPMSPPPTTPTELISRGMAAHLRRIGQVSYVSSQLRTYRWLPGDPIVRRHRAQLRGLFTAPSTSGSGCEIPSHDPRDTPGSADTRDGDGDHVVRSHRGFAGGLSRQPSTVCPRQSRLGEVPHRNGGPHMIDGANQPAGDRRQLVTIPRPQRNGQAHG